MGDSADNRRGNIALVAQKLTGAVVKPGETFSFNHTVGARTVKAGYREAPIIVDGEKKKGIGGGVCQVSTTLYNAALEAGFEIVERHEHTKDVAYVPDGKDAAVSYGSWDLRFRNTTASAYVIRCEVTQTRVTVVLTPQGE
jgi:vancomycin resistance protein YoaR